MLWLFALCLFRSYISVQRPSHRFDKLKYNMKVSQCGFAGVGSEQAIGLIHINCVADYALSADF